ncbi:MAG: 2-oxo acid dehydrogenase subunit E2, partial [Salegentibacter sp.]
SEEQEDSEDKETKKKKSGKDQKEERASDSEPEESEEEEEGKEKDDVEEPDKKEKKVEAGKKSSKEDKEGEKESKSAGVAAASPGVRRLARELGVDVNSVEGGGENGRISEEDVKAFVKQKRGGAEAATLSLPDFSKWGETERKPLSGIRKATGKNVTASWQNIPHVFQFEEADISGIEDYIEKHAEKAEKAGGKLTITAILLKISATALRQFPKFNASIDPENEEMILKKYMNIGIAVDTKKGLLVPVIRDVDRKSIVELSVELTKIAEKAREGKLNPEEMQGGNFTISNLGGIGGTNFTPIIYHPQVAILGVSRAKVQPVWKNDQFEPRQVLPLSLSYDHRLIDGAEGAEFIHWMAKALEDPYEALLGS